MSPLHNFSIGSQLLIGQSPASLPVSTELQNGTTSWVYTVEQLPNFINSSEWSLASTTRIDPLFNFVVFVPATYHAPTHLIYPNDSIVETNAFTIPKWGGILIHNPTHKTASTNMSRHILDLDDLHGMMQVFLAQFRGLLGIHPLQLTLLQNKVTTQVDLATKSGITDWELDALIRMRMVELIQGAISTLESLSRLVTAQGHMMVAESIRERVESAISHVEEACQQLDHDGSILDALEHARLAHELAQQAFFDPSMVGMLYFPDEHKMAVYMPLFVPAAVPLVLGLLRELRAWRQARVHLKVE